MKDQQQETLRRSPSTPQQLEDPARSWWRSPLFGYLSAAVFTAVAFLIPWSERSLGLTDYLVEPPFVIATLLVGWLWGSGPALLVLLFGVLTLDYWVVPPVGVIDFFLWPGILSFGPFILIQLIALWLVIRQKRYRQQLLLAHQAASTHAQELAEKNAQLDEANHLKDLFLSRASHELKTPITTIQGQAQLGLRRLARHPSPEHDAFLVTHLEKIATQTHRLNDLVNDLLNLSSLRSGKLPLQLAPCDLCSICRELVEDQRALYNRCICLLAPPDPVMLQADAGRLSQVVTNLVVNALKYSSAHSVIEVKVLQKESQAIVTVHNEGAAIPPERLDHLFEPFYRTPETQASAIQGWGLGLAISKEIVEQHDGSLGVESSEEKGTTFFVELPWRPE